MSKAVAGHVEEAGTEPSETASGAHEKKLRDGYRWITLSDHDKCAYVCGMIDGMYVTALIPAKGRNWRLEAGETVTRLLGDAPVAFWVDELDRIYANPANHKIATIHALAIAIYGRSGVPVKQVYDMIYEARQFGDMVATLLPQLPTEESIV